MAYRTKRNLNNLTCHYEDYFIGFGDLKGVPVISFCNTTLTPLIVNSYTIQPNDIHANENLTLSIYATLNEKVTSGKIIVDAKVGPIPVYNKGLDLCTELQAGNMSCPLDATNYKIAQSIEIPAIPLHGNIKASVKMTDQTNKELLCMNVKVHV